MVLKNSSAGFQLGAQKIKKMSEFKDSCQIHARFWIWIKKFSLDYQYQNKPVFISDIVSQKFSRVFF